MEDLTGKQFNNWLVIKYCGNSEWICECQCENKTIKKIRTYMLKSGGSKSCGCGRVTLQLKDLTGKQFGNWIVKEYAGNSNWLCECQCKNKTTKILAGRDLKSGGSKSCGCMRTKLGNAYGTTKKNTQKIKPKHEIGSRLKDDLTGKTFGNWIVLKYLGKYKWLCECQCENKTKREISRYDLINGRSTNCGCKRSKDLTNKVFGRLTVKKYLGNMTWECECSCDKHTVVKVLTCNLISGGTKSCGCIKNESLYTKEEYMEVIKKYINKYNDKPYLDDIAKLIGIHKENVRHNIDKYNLWEYINKSFGSHYEHDLYLFCKQFTNDVISRDRKVIYPQELDIYIPSKKLAIEFNGDYWHSEYKLNNKKYHQQKTITCAKQGIKLIHIFEHEWNDLNKQIKIENYIKRLLSDSQNTLYARNTVIKSIAKDVADEFCNKYHLQGDAHASIHYGCYKDNELLGVMTFGYPRFNNNYQYEIIRLCWKNDIKVIGGTEKLFKHFIDEFNPESIITYTDISKFTGNVYNRLGFHIIQPNPITEPNYVWVSQESDIVLTRYQTQKHKLLEQGLGTSEQTEDEIMYGAGYIKVYDCGNLKLEWYKN